jgi:hypothetical protein
MNTKKIVLSEEEKKQRLKESKRKYYLKNKEKYKKWNNECGFKNIIEKTENENELIQYLSLINQKLEELRRTSVYDNTNK